MNRLVDLVTREPLKGIRQLIALLVLIGLIFALGGADAASGSVVTFGAFYLAPVIAAAVLCGTRSGQVVAAVAAMVWSTADTAISGVDRPGAAIAVNVAVRFVIFSVVIVLLERLRDAVNDARRSEQRSQDFLAFAAHQLRTPTAAASAAAQAMLANGVEPEQEDLLVRIIDETNRSGRLVASMLRYLRVDHAGVMPRSSVDVSELCREAVERSRHLAPHLDTHLAGNGAAPVAHVNRTAVAEALDCLLDNARRHAAGSIAVATSTVNGRAEITVTDDGPGLPAGHEGEAFSPFVSIDRQGGTGLGLAIARGLVEGQHGTLSYEAGRFVIRLPVATG